MKRDLSVTRTIPLLIVTLLFGVTSAVAAQDSDENALDIPWLNGEHIVTRAFEDGIYAHLYAFVGAEGDVVTIAMNRVGESEVDPFLLLLGANGAVLAVDDDGGSVVRNALIEEFELPEDGNYLVLATFAEYILAGGNVLDPAVLAGEEELDPLEYELVVDGLEPFADEDESPVLELEAQEVEIGDSVMLEVSSEMPVAYVTFLAEDGDTVTIATAPDDEEVDTIIYLFSRQGEVLTFNDDGATVSLYSEIADYELSADGMYLVLATVYQFYGAVDSDWEVAGAFELSVE